jgi:hypothetical protein
MNINILSPIQCFYIINKDKVSNIGNIKDGNLNYIDIDDKRLINILNETV